MSRVRTRPTRDDTREKLFERLHQELPYHSTVETESWKELRNGEVRIEQTTGWLRPDQRQLPWQPGQARLDVPKGDERVRRQAQRELDPEQYDRFHRPSSGGDDSPLNLMPSIASLPGERA